MDLTFSKEDLDFQAEVRDFLTSEYPLAIKEKQDKRLPLEKEDIISWQKILASKGWFAINWPKEYGGAGLTPTQIYILQTELAGANTPILIPFGVNMCGPVIYTFGTEEQKKKFLPGILNSDTWWCQGYSEPESGSDLASLQTRAVEDGDDFIINGTKIWTSSAHRADHIMVLTRTDPDAPKHRGISFLLCDMNTPGLTVNPIINMAGDHGFNMVTFDNVRVPKKNLVGEQNRGWYVGATLLDFERSGVDYSAGGRRVLEELTDYAKNSNQNGSLISDNPIMRNRLANLAIEVEVSRLISYNIAWMQGEGLVPNKESSMGKVVGTELQQHLSETGMQMLGLHGQLEPGSKYAPLDGRIEHMHLTNVSETIQAGTSEIQRNIIATRGLGLPRG